MTADYKKILDDANIKKPKFDENFIYQIKLKKGNQETYLKKLIEKDEKILKNLSMNIMLVKQLYIH